MGLSGLGGQADNQTDDLQRLGAIPDGSGGRGPLGEILSRRKATYTRYILRLGHAHERGEVVPPLLGRE